VIEYTIPNDILYVNINCRGASVAVTKDIDDRRVVSFAEDGSVVSVTFMGVNDSLVLDGLPQREDIEAALERLARVLAHKG
jgi:uncharacterized protein YuzE